MTAPISLTVGGTDITAHVSLDSIVVSESGCRQAGHLECDVKDVTSGLTLSPKALVQLWDDNDARYVFTGHLNPADINALGTGRSFHLSCDDLGEVLDTSLVIGEKRPPESFLVRMTYLITTYGPRLPAVFTKIENLAGTLPVALYENTTLRGAIEMTCSLAGTTVDYFVDGAGIVNAGTALLGAAPFAFRVGTPGYGEITPEEPFTITRDPKAVVNAYWIRGANDAGSGWVTDAASIAIYGRIESYADAPDADTGPKRDAVGNALLADNSTSSLIGKAHVTVANGFRPGQTLTIVSAPQFDIASPQTYRINLVTRHYFAGGTLKDYDLQFGGLIPMWSTSIPTPQSWPGSRIASGSLGLTPFASTIRPVAIVATLPTLPDALYPVECYVVLTTDSKLYQNVAGAWVNATQNGLPVGFQPIPPVGTLPTLPDANYPLGFVVYLTTDGKLYRNVGVWTAAIASADVSGLIVGSLPALPNAAYPDGIIVVSTTDYKLYRNHAGTWVKAVDGADLTAASISHVALVAHTLTASEIAAATITTTEIAAGTIVAGNIAAATITASQIAAATITGDRLVAGTITASQIASNTITASQILAGTITAGCIAAGAIGVSQLAASAVTADKIAAHAVSADKLAIGGVSNLLTNPGWEASAYGDTCQQNQSPSPIAGWSLVAWSGTGAYMAVNSPGAGEGLNYLAFYSGTTGGCGAYSGKFSVAPYETVAISYLMYGTACANICWYDGAGAQISVVGFSATSPGSWGRQAGWAVAPSNAVWAAIRLDPAGAATWNNYDDVQVLRGGVVIDRSGVTIYNGKLTVVNPGSTVIIDGTSDMLKVAATGTLQTAAFTGPGNQTATVDIATGFTYSPATHTWLQSALCYTCPYTSFYSTTGVAWYIYEVGVQVVNTNQTQVAAKTTATTPAGTPAMPISVYRYYVMVEAAF